MPSSSKVVELSKQEAPPPNPDEDDTLEENDITHGTLMRRALWGMVTFMGILPLKIEDPRKALAYKIYGKFTVFFYALLNVRQYIDLYQKLARREFGAVLYNMGITLTCTVTLIKTFTVLNDVFIKLLRQLRKIEVMILRGENEKIKTLYKEYAVHNNKLSLTMYLLAGGTIIFYCFSPFVALFVKRFVLMDKEAELVRNVPFASWLPYDQIEYYYLTVAINFVDGFYGGGVTAVTDAYLWSLMMFTISQLKILQMKFRNYREDAREMMRLVPGITEHEAVRLTVRNCIDMHKFIIKFIGELDNAMRMLVLLDFIICSAILSSTCVMIMFFGSEKSILISGIEYLTTISTQTLIFYWHANEITLESLLIERAIWESDWTELDNETIKDLQFVIMRSQRALVLNIGPFYPMSNSACLSIFKGAYSYVAIMKQGQDKS